MTHDATQVHSYGDLAEGIWTAPFGSTLPTTITPGVWPSGWQELGWLSDAGVTDDESYTETSKYGWQGGALVRKLRGQAEKTYQFEALEENAVVLGLLRPGTTVTTSGGVNVRPLQPFTGQNLRYFGIDLIDGSYWKRIVLTNAEAVRDGSQTYKADDLTIYPFTLLAYLDGNQQWGYELTSIVSGATPAVPLLTLVDNGGTFTATGLLVTDNGGTYTITDPGAADNGGTLTLTA